MGNRQLPSPPQQHRAIGARVFRSISALRGLRSPAIAPTGSREHAIGLATAVHGSYAASQAPLCIWHTQILCCQTCGSVRVTGERYRGITATQSFLVRPARIRPLICGRITAPFIKDEKLFCRCISSGLTAPRAISAASKSRDFCFINARCSGSNTA